MFRIYDLSQASAWQYPISMYDSNNNLTEAKRVAMLQGFLTYLSFVRIQSFEGLRA